MPFFETESLPSISSLQFFSTVRLPTYENTYRVPVILSPGRNCRTDFSCPGQLCLVVDFSTYSLRIEFQLKVIDELQFICIPETFLDLFYRDLCKRR